MGSQNLIISSETALGLLFGISQQDPKGKADHDEKMGISQSQGQLMVVRVRAFWGQNGEE